MRHNELLQHKRELDERLRAGSELLDAAQRAEARAWRRFDGTLEAGDSGLGRRPMAYRKLLTPPEAEK